jgi:hypothetical protein
VIGFLLARQRSGTGALGSLLARHPGLRYLGEVLHPNPERAAVRQVLDEDLRAEDVNFFRYVHADVARMRGFCDPNQRADVVERYFDWLKERFHPRIPIVDVKYNSLHHWNRGWQGLFEAPWLIRHVREKKLPIIHLKRKNSLQTYISGRLAEVNQVWHATSSGAMKTRDMEVDVDGLLSSLTQTSREIDLMNKWLRRIETLTVIEYAELFSAEGTADPRIMREIKDLFNLEDDFTVLEPVFVKQAQSSILASISNPRAVRRALRGGRFAWMLKPG